MWLALSFHDNGIDAAVLPKLTVEDLTAAPSEARQKLPIRLCGAAVGSAWLGRR
jgi:hypothetical protein